MCFKGLLDRACQETVNHSSTRQLDAVCEWATITVKLMPAADTSEQQQQQQTVTTADRNVNENQWHSLMPASAA
jgi:hypothetical protein